MLDEYLFYSPHTIFYVAGLLISLIGAYFLARFIETRLATTPKKWLRITLALMGLLFSFIAFTIIIVIIGNSLPGEEWGR